MNPYGVPVVDAHLDMAYNVENGRDLRLTAAEIRKAESLNANQCMVTLPELERGDVAIAFATIYVRPADFSGGAPTYDPPATDQANAQIEIYQTWEEEGRVRIIRDRSALQSHMSSWPNDRKLGIVILMEGADPIEDPGRLKSWWDKDVRMIGPAWSQTRYAGGTGRPGGLSPDGRELVASMKELGIVLDASHLAEDSFWEALDIGVHSLMASHSNSRALVSSDRQLTDEMIKAIGGRDGVVGLVLYNGFIDPSWERGKPQVPFDALRPHSDRISTLIGWDHIAVGSDFDGAIGLEETPEGFDTVADLWKMGDLAPKESVGDFLSGNWLRFLEKSLPT